MSGRRPTRPQAAKKASNATQRGSGGPKAPGEKPPIASKPASHARAAIDALTRAQDGPQPQANAPAPAPAKGPPTGPKNDSRAGGPTRKSIADAVREAEALIASAAPAATPATWETATSNANASATEGSSATNGATKDAPAPISSEEVAARIHALENRLDSMIEAAARGTLRALSEEADRSASSGLSSSRPAAIADIEERDIDVDPLAARDPVIGDFAVRIVDAVDGSPPPPAASTMFGGSVKTSPSPDSRALAPDAESAAFPFDTARELLSTNYYLRKWGRLGMRNRSEEVDDFGYDPVYETRVKPFIDFLYSTYFRVEASGVDHVPTEGRCLLVSNHSGTLPFDGLMIRAAVKREHPGARDVRWLAEDFIFHFPFIGSFTTRIGAVRACQENAERLLRQDALVAVFPEGMKGTGKLFRDRYRLQRFGRGGFIKLALRTGTPIVPVAVLGGEETQPLLARLDSLGRSLGFPYVPVTPTFPLLGPLGLAPAPTKWKIVFGRPIHSQEGPSAADDELLIGRLAEQVRGTIQEMVDDLVEARRSVFFG